MVLLVSIRAQITLNLEPAACHVEWPSQQGRKRAFNDDLPVDMLNLNQTRIFCELQL